MAKKKNNTFKDFKKNLKSSQIRYNKVSLETLKDAVTNHKQIDISNKETLKDASQIIIIKRNGSKVPFNKKKLEKVVLWATGSEILMKELIADTEIKLHKEIKITEMYQQLILTAVNKISMLQPQWENIAAKLQLLSYYKETYNISETFDIKKGKIYPSLEEVLKKGIEHKIYDKKYLQMLSEDELKKLDQAIDYERDFLIDYFGFKTLEKSYLMKIKGKIIEKGKALEIFSNPIENYTKGLLYSRPNNKVKLSKLPTVADYINNSVNNTIIND